MSYAGLGTAPMIPQQTTPSVPSYPTAPSYPTPLTPMSRSYPGGQSSPGQSYPVAPTIPQVSPWRRSLSEAFQSISAALMSLFSMLPDTTKPTVVAWAAGATPNLQPVQDLSNWARDPSKSDADVAGKLGEVREMYRGMRQNVPTPFKSALDQFADSVVNLVPNDLKPASFAQPIQPVLAQSAEGFGVPWLWIGGSFLVGFITGRALGGGRSVSPNRWVRRNRRRR